MATVVAASERFMTLRSVSDVDFLGPVEEFLLRQKEMLVLIQYSRAAGSKDFEFFTSFLDLTGRLRQLPPDTRVTAFTTHQLPIRGIVDDEFISDCLRRIRAVCEFLVVSTAPRAAGKYTWFHHDAGTSHSELRETLEGLRGDSVAVGEYPAWTSDSTDAIAAYVPDPSGNVCAGVY